MTLYTGFQRLLGHQVRGRHDADDIVTAVENRKRADPSLAEPGRDLLERCVRTDRHHIRGHDVHYPGTHDARLLLPLLLPPVHVHATGPATSKGPASGLRAACRRGSHHPACSAGVT